MQFSISGLCGDVIYSLPTVRAFTSKAELNLIPCVYRNHFFPVDLAHKLIPLLDAQPYVKSARLRDTKEGIDLDSFRNSGLKLSEGHIPSYFLTAFHQTADLSLPWLSVEPYIGFASTIVVNLTPRYRNALPYDLLKGRQVVFVGLWAEYLKCRIGEYHPVSNALDIARIIKGCKLFIGNQSFSFSVAEALKVPRILEQCEWCPNVQPQGGAYRVATSADTFEKALHELTT